MDVDPAPEDEASALPKARGLGAGAALWHDEAANTQKIYVDRQFFASYEDQVQALTDSKTVYIGNLSFYTTEAQIVELCSRTGPVKKVIMGLNRHTKEPCGFCFVEHYSSEAALDTVSRITGLVLDDRPLRAELDFGFRDGRQFASVFIFHIIDRRGRTLFTELLHTLTPCDETTKTKLPWHRGDTTSIAFRVGVRGPSLSTTQVRPRPERRPGARRPAGHLRPARDARRGADVVDAPAPAPAAPEEEPAAETVSGAKKRLRDDDDDESEDDAPFPWCLRGGVVWGPLCCGAQAPMRGFCPHDFSSAHLPLRTNRIHAAKNRLRLPLCVARSQLRLSSRPSTKLRVSEPTKTVSLAVNHAHASTRRASTLTRELRGAETRSSRGDWPAARKSTLTRKDIPAFPKTAVRTAPRSTTARRPGGWPGPNDVIGVPQTQN